jgi:hypothetical protein
MTTSNKYSLKKYLLNERKVKINILEIAEEFRQHLLDTFEFTDSGPGHLNCAWVTFYFIKWAASKGVPVNSLKALYIVEPKESKVKELKDAGILGAHYPLEGEAHIMPAIGDTMIDPTYRQFDASGPHTKITPYSEWESVYGKFGYGKCCGVSNSRFYKGEDHKFGSPEEVKTWAHWGIIEYPPARK